MHECSPEHLHMKKVRLKLNKETEEEVMKMNMNVERRTPGAKKKPDDLPAQSHFGASCYASYLRPKCIDQTSCLRVQTMRRVQRISTGIEEVHSKNPRVKKKIIITFFLTNRTLVKINNTNENNYCYFPLKNLVEISFTEIKQ